MRKKLINVIYKNKTLKKHKLINVIYKKIKP